MTNKLQQNYPQFFELNGTALNDGYIYIGVDGLDPTTNAIPVYLDASLTTPISQPLRTTGGYVYYNGNPVSIYFGALNYSITVKNSLSSLIYTNLSAYTMPFVNTAMVVENIAELKTFSNAEANQIEVLGYYSKGDGGGGLFYWDSTSIATDNGGTIIQATGVTTGRWKRVFSGAVNVKWFGAKGDGVADDTVAIQNTISYISSNFDFGFGGTVFFPKVLNNGFNSYLISSTVKVPPSVILLGEGVYNKSNKSGSNIQVSHDGVGIRFIRRNTSSLFHLGGMENIAITGTNTSTLNQRLVELGDSDNIDTTNGAWNGFIKDCLFNNTRGYGIYSAHSQEWFISHNFFTETNRAIYYKTVPASCRIKDNSFINESATNCDFAVCLEQGNLGGSGNSEILSNYFMGFKIPIYITACKGFHIENNSIELSRTRAITISTTTYDGTDLGFSSSTLCQGNIEGNIVIGCGTNGSSYGIILKDVQSTVFKNNTFSSPYATLVAALHLIESTTNSTSSNFIQIPYVYGNNASSVNAIDYNNSLYSNNTVYSNRISKPRSDVTNPVLSSNFAGATTVTNGVLNVLKTDNNWSRIATVGGKTIAAGTTTTSVLGYNLIINQNNNATTLSALTDGIIGQIVVIRAINANTPVSITGTTVTITIYKTLTVIFDGNSWVEIGRTF